VRALALVRSGPVTRRSLVAAGVGAVMLAEPVTVVPGAWPVTIAGAAALLAAAAGRWPAAGTLAALAAAVTSGIGIAAGTVTLPLAAISGTLVLAYLFALDAAESGPATGRRRWVRGRLLALAAGFAAALITAAAAATTVPAWPWLVLAGVAAAGATLITATG
jgi:hypothetical protein